jgi:hypothetical protein
MTRLPSHSAALLFLTLASVASLTLASVGRLALLALILGLTSLALALVLALGLLVLSVPRAVIAVFGEIYVVPTGTVQLTATAMLRVTVTPGVAMPMEAVAMTLPAATTQPSTAPGGRPTFAFRFATNTGELQLTAPASAPGCVSRDLGVR